MKTEIDEHVRSVPFLHISYSLTIKQEVTSWLWFLFRFCSVFVVSIHFLKSSFNTSTYQTLSSVQRAFVFLGSRCTQPLTLRIFKMADRPKREIKKTKRLCNEYSTYTLVRKANPRKKDTNCMILRSIWY